MTDTIFQAVAYNDDRSGSIIGIGRAVTIPDAIRNAMLSSQAERDGCGEFTFEVYEVEIGSPLNYVVELDRAVMGVFADAA